MERVVDCVLSLLGRQFFLHCLCCLQAVNYVEEKRRRCGLIFMKQILNAESPKGDMVCTRSYAIQCSLKATFIRDLCKNKKGQLQVAVCPPNSGESINQSLPGMFFFTLTLTCVTSITAPFF